MTRALRPLLLCLPALVASPPAAALEWAAGLGLTSVHFPAYRGARGVESLTLPIPTINLDAQRWRIGRGGAQYDFGGSSRWTLRLSASGSLPVDSEEVVARRGMPDLDPSLELGPALICLLSERPDFELNAELLLRTVVALDLAQPRDVGMVGQSRLALRWQPAQFDLRLASGPLWATRRYHAYFYDVAPRYVTEARPAYRSAAGYSGWRSQLVGSWRHQRLGLHAFVLWDALSGAVFDPSPLLERRSYAVAGLMLSWRLAQGARD